MSVGDSGARPKDSKLEPHTDMGAALYELEKQEKTFEKELKQFTPKKGLDDIGLLKAERDELKRQVMRNPKQDENKYWFCSNYQRGRATERALILQLLVTRGRWSDICALRVTSQIKLSVSVLIKND